MASHVNGLWALALWGSAIAACGPSRESEDRDKVMKALEVLRAHPPTDYASRAAAADELARLDLATPMAIEARDACSKGYRMLAEATSLTASTERSMRDTSQPSDPRKLVQDLRRSEELLLDAEPLVEKCNGAASRLVTSP